MTREELIERVNKFQGANREFSQELPPIVEALCDEIDAAGPEVVDSLTSNSKTKALSANQGKNLKEMVDEKIAFPEVAGEAGQFLGVDAEGNPEWQPVSSTGEPADAEMSDTSTNAVQNKVITEELDKCAKKDGYYDSLTAGFATNLVDTKGTGTEQEFIRRTSCGDESIADDGTGVIQEINGKTIAWNQSVDDSGLRSSGSTSDLTFTYNNHTLTINGTNNSGSTIFTDNILGYINISVISGHKYYFKGYTNGNGTELQFFSASAGNLTLSRDAIATCAFSADDVLCRYRIAAGASFNNFKVYFQFFDLTLMFGAGNEPSTVAEFKALYPELYYARASVLKSNDAAALLTDGFNQWDEVAELGGINSADGQNSSSTTTGRSKNYIPVFGGTTYYAKTAQKMYTRYYDASKNYIGYLSKDNKGSVLNEEFTTPDNCAYMRFVCDAAIASDSICINLSWSGYRNGEYEPYWQRVLALRLSELTGIPEGGTEADRVTMFPNGLGGAGSAFDALFVENGVTKARKTMLAEVDLGDLEWIKGNYAFYATLEEVFRPNLICSKYVAYDAEMEGSAMDDKTIAKGSGNAIYIKDSAYTDAATFQAAMDGVKLIVEAATPIVYTDLQYADGTPFTMPKVYQVADFGTETIVQPEGATEPSAPFRAIIKYNNDLTREVVNLPKNYDTTDGIDALCSALATALSSALNGTLTITRGNYSESDKRYAFTVTFTPNE